MERNFDSDLEALNLRLLTMSSLAEASAHEAVEAVLWRDDARVQSVKDRDILIDRLEIEIDDLAISLLSRAPLARDLRLVTVAMKISQNLERVGDEATKIAKRAHALNAEPPFRKNGLDLATMRTLALEMLKAALDAFVKRDPVAARLVIEKDVRINTLNKQNHRELLGHMVEDRENITRCLSLMVISKSLERIADHAGNIAEEIVYLCEALDIRHAKHQQPPLVVAPA
jgi:phosphate transport system protein